MRALERFTDPSDCRERVQTSSFSSKPISKPGALAYGFAELLAAKFPERRTLLTRLGTPVLRAGDLGQIHAPRGVGKTWLVQTIGLIAASGAAALGFEASEQSNVLLIDGEMAAQETQERLNTLKMMLGIDGEDIPFRTIAADWQDRGLPRLDTPDGQQAVAAEVEKADLVICDNRSCLFDPEAETDPAAWGPAQDWLLGLRRQGKAVAIVHHSNRQGGARGHSKPEDLMNVLIKLSRPEGYSAETGAAFVAQWEKARGVHGPAVAPFSATLGPEGWIVVGDPEGSAAEKRILAFLSDSNNVGERPTRALQISTGAGVRYQDVLKALNRLLERGTVVKEKGYFLR